VGVGEVELVFLCFGDRVWGANGLWLSSVGVFHQLSRPLRALSIPWVTFHVLIKFSKIYILKL
jgi:hypothetical protein